MDEVKTTLEHFIELGDKHFFRLRDGTPFEGWILEVGEMFLTFADSGPLATEENVTVKLTDIDLSTLAYRSKEGWLDYS